MLHSRPPPGRMRQGTGSGGGAWRGWLLSSILAVLLLYMSWGKWSAEGRAKKLAKQVKELRPQLMSYASEHHEHLARHEKHASDRADLEAQLLAHMRDASTMDERLQAAEEALAQADEQWQAQLNECEDRAASQRERVQRLMDHVRKLESAHHEREADWHHLLQRWKDKEHALAAALAAAKGVPFSGAGSAAEADAEGVLEDEPRERPATRFDEELREAMIEAAEEGHDADEL